MVATVLELRQFILLSNGKGGKTIQGSICDKSPSIADPFAFIIFGDVLHYKNMYYTSMLIRMIFYRIYNLKGTSKNRQ